MFLFIFLRANEAKEIYFKRTKLEHAPYDLIIMDSQYKSEDFWSKKKYGQQFKGFEHTSP